MYVANGPREAHNNRLHAEHWRPCVSPKSQCLDTHPTQHCSTAAHATNVSVRSRYNEKRYRSDGGIDELVEEGVEEAIDDGYGAA